MNATPPDMAARDADARRAFQGRVRIVRVMEGLVLAIFLTIILVGYQAQSVGEQLADPLAGMAMVAGVVVVILILFFTLWFLKCPFCDGTILKRDSRGLQFVWNVARCRHCKERLK